MSIRTRTNIILMAVFGPAETGPYGEAPPPPAPRPRNAKGRLLSRKKIEELARMNAAKATAVARLDGIRQALTDALTTGPIPH